jgi:hypothetical protein
MAEGLHVNGLSSLQLMKASIFLCGKVLFKYKKRKKERKNLGVLCRVRKEA